MAKKKKKKSEIVTLMVLILVIIALGFGYFVARSFSENNGEEIDSLEDKKLIQIDVSKAKTLKYTLKGKEYAFVNENGIWKVEMEKDRPLNQNAIMDMVSLFEDMTASKIVYKNQDRIADFGLNKPALTVTLTMEDESSYSYSSGVSVVNTESGCYAVVQGFPGIYFLPEGYYNLFIDDLINMTQLPSITDITSENLTRIKITKNSKVMIDLNQDKNTEQWMIKEPYDYNVRTNADNMKILLNNYISYRFLQNIDYHCTDFSKYGLDKPSSEIYLEYFTKDYTSSTTTNHTLKLSVGNLEDDAVNYVRVNDGNSVYTMSSNNIDLLTNVDPIDYVYTTLVDTDISDVAKASFTVKGKVYDLQIERSDTIGTGDKEDKNTKNVYKINGIEKEASEVGTFYSKVNLIKIVGKVGKNVNDSKPVCSIKVTDTSQKEFNYNLLEYDENHYAVQHKGHIHFLVDKKSVDSMVQTLEAL